MNIDKKQWGEHQGRDIWLYSITSDSLQIDVTNYGCTITAIRVKGIESKEKNIILGYSTAEELLADKYYMGCIVGRYAGRIGKSSFEIDTQTYHLPANDGTSGNHLHGGPEGFNKRLFEEVAVDCNEESASISFHATSEDLDQGYPGMLDITFTITVNARNEIVFSYLAKPDRPTYINLTHHLYYNLGGKPAHAATEQHLYIDADLIAETTKDYLPTGKIISVPQQADFRISRKIPAGHDYNECFVLNQRNLSEFAAEVIEPATGLTLAITTTCPAIIFYSGQFLDKPFYPKQGMCLETQYFPDAPNQSNFPSTLYSGGSVFTEQTKLSIMNIT